MAQFFFVTEKQLEALAGRYIEEDHLRNPQGTEAFYSVCQADGFRWFWAAWASLSQVRGQAGGQAEPLAYGYAPTKEEAEVLGRQAIGVTKPDCFPDYFLEKITNHLTGNTLLCLWKMTSRHQECLYHFSGAEWAERYLAQATARAKTAEAKSESETPSMEFLYRHELSDDGPKTCKHRVVKKTDRFIFVEEEAWREERKLFGDFRDLGVKTWMLRRLELEARGYVKMEDLGLALYLSPDHPDFGEEWSSIPHLATPLAVLGLTPPCTIRDIKRAFRIKSKQLHPDLGGDQNAFVLLRQSYEKALGVIAAMESA
ncbi:MAG: J domain-containing protein [Deltaproteobacteria bacterium]|nr:J domain-containing protein [Deltaproteobacteria bacterium]